MKKKTNYKFGNRTQTLVSFSPSQPSELQYQYAK